MDDLNPMHNPPHPGEFISQVYLEPFGVSGRELAQQMDVSASTLVTSSLTRGFPHAGTLRDSFATVFTHAEPLSE
jgi:hypothetical protein